MLAARHDDDDDIYICVCVYIYIYKVFNIVYRSSFIFTHTKISDDIFKKIRKLNDNLFLKMIRYLV